MSDYLTLHNVLQGLMLVCAGLGMQLVRRESKRVAMWGWVLGLVSQPMFIYAAWTSEPMQWGFFVLALVLLHAWGMGAWEHWQAMRRSAADDEAVAAMAAYVAARTRKSMGEMRRVAQRPASGGPVEPGVFPSIHLGEEFTVQRHEWHPAALDIQARGRAARAHLHVVVKGPEA